jgi:hypothetical protein
MFGERTLISLAEKLGVAEYFSGPHGVVLSTTVPKSTLYRQTLPTSNETNVFNPFMVKVSPK